MSTTKADKIRRRLAKDAVLPYQAAAVGMEVFTLTTELVHSDACSLISDFMSALQRWELQDVLENQVNYAVRLARDAHDLLYEEMHKLFSLLDEIHALRTIGLTVAPRAIEELNSAVRTRFEMQASVAALVAKDRVEDWCQTLWWYADNLR